MKRLYISCPRDIQNKETMIAEIEQAKTRAKEILKDDTIILIPTSNYSNMHVRSIWNLSRSIDRMTTADLIYFPKDWKEYNSSVIEHEVAVRYNLNNIEYVED